MPLLWFNSGISDRTRAKMVELFYELGGDIFVWPADDYKPVSGRFKLEDTEEIDRLMRQRPKGRVRIG